jgi:TolB protein
VPADTGSRILSIAAAGGDERLVGAVPGRVQALSADARHVLFASGDWNAVTLVVASVDGSEARTLRANARVLWNVRWSPDERQIAYTGENEASPSNLAVWTMDADGHHARQVTRLPTEEGRAQVPAWSPDGRRLGFQASRRDHVGHLWVLDLATGAARKLGPHTEAYVDETPSWFPDGKRLAFQSDRTGRMEVWVIDEDGSGARQVTR